ncbi:HupE/UreJ family protein [Xylophilus sp. Kf1]|nr:HupE/UreJ family protein [Xylophilus sp. Kf1]
MRCCDGSMVRRMLRWLFLACACVATSMGTAQAHKASDAYLQFRKVDDNRLHLRWDIALRDLDAVLPIDANGDGELRWGEVRNAFPAIDRYVLPHLQWPAGCVPTAPQHALEQRSDGAYVVLQMEASCPLTAGFTVGYTLFADIDPTHRGLATIHLGDGQPRVVLLGPALPAASVSQAGAADAAVPASFVAEGIHHILTGYDHILFLLSLLLPAVVRRDGGRWVPVGSAREALAPVLGVVTLFTLAHSITLALAAFGWVSLSPAFIEPAIAATIIVAAADNLRPVFGRLRYLVTFLFGLIHGFGFAGALQEMNLPPLSFAWALLKFNLGIEAGQLALVAVAVPLLFVLRRWSGYRRWVLQAGSVVAIVLAVIWLVERVADVVILPWTP